MKMKNPIQTTLAETGGASSSAFPIAATPPQSPVSAFSISSFAALWNVGHKTIRAEIAKGKLLAVRVGGQWRISQREAERYEAARASAPALRRRGA